MNRAQPGAVVGRDHRLRRIMNALQVPEGTFRLTIGCVRCLRCCTSITTLSQNSIYRHLITQKHRDAVQTRNLAIFPTENDFRGLSSRQSALFNCVTETFIKSDIALEKINHLALKASLERLTGFTIPIATTLRDEYVDLVFNDIMNQIKAEIVDNPIYILVDETVDSSGRCVVNCIIGALYSDRPSTPRLLNCEEMQNPCGASINDFVDRSLNILWPGGIHYDRVLLYITDAAPYMKLSGGLLANRYQKMVHVTCLAHACHNVAERVRLAYPDANNLISDGKEIFVRARQRVIDFQIRNPRIPLPPKPVITRWGTWLKAAQYYCRYYDNVWDFVIRLPTESAAIERLQENMTDEVHEEFEEIAEKYSCLIEILKILQSRNNNIIEICGLIDDLVEDIVNDDEIPDEIRNYMERVIEGNQGFSLSIKNIKNCLESGVFNNLPANWTPNDARRMIFAPLQSADVERSFSFIKTQYRPNRHGFIFENFAKYVIINYNQF